MKVRMTVSMHGPNVTREIGDVVDLPDAQAEFLILRGYATRTRRRKKADEEHGSEHGSEQAISQSAQDREER